MNDAALLPGSGESGSDRHRRVLDRASSSGDEGDRRLQPGAPAVNPQAVRVERLDAWQRSGERTDR